MFIKDYYLIRLGFVNDTRLKAQSMFNFRNEPSMPKSSIDVLALPGRRDSSVPYFSCSFK